jgi:hypothetical protein
LSCAGASWLSAEPVASTIAMNAIRAQLVSQRTRQLAAAGTPPKRCRAQFLFVNMLHDADENGAPGRSLSGCRMRRLAQVNYFFAIQFRLRMSSTSLVDAVLPIGSVEWSSRRRNAPQPRSQVIGERRFVNLSCQSRLGPRRRTKLKVFSVRTKLSYASDEQVTFEATSLNIPCQCATLPKEEDRAVRRLAIVSAIIGVLALSGVAAPAPAQAGLASTPYGCDPSGGRYPGYAPPYAYAAYYYGYPPDCGGLGITFYFPSRHDGDRYVEPRYVHHSRHRGHHH